MPKDTWPRDYNRLVELGADIGIKIRERDENKSLQLNPQLSKLLQDYQKRLQALESLNQRQSKDYTIPDDEIGRRRSMTEELNTKYEHLKRCFNRGWTSDARYRSTGGASGFGGGADDRLSEVDRIHAQHQEIISEQDEGLEELSRAAKSQQKMGLTMQDEIQEHNVLIDEIHEHTHRTERKVREQTVRAAEYRRKDSCKCTCALWTTIVLLAVIIVVVGAVPFG